jgi:hypothetical protein
LQRAAIRRIGWNILFICNRYMASNVCSASQKTAEKYATNSHHYSHQN